MNKETEVESKVDLNEWKRQNPLLRKRVKPTGTLDHPRYSEFFQVLKVVDSKVAEHTKYSERDAYLCLSRDAELVSIVDGPSRIVSPVSRTRFIGAIRQAAEKVHILPNILVGEIVTMPNGIQTIEHWHFTPVRYYEIWAAREDGREGIRNGAAPAGRKKESFTALVRSQPQVAKNGNVTLLLREHGSDTDVRAVAFAQNEAAVQAVMHLKLDDMLVFDGIKALSSFTKQLEFKIWEVLKSA